jgi:PAS domain S-box/diguanylate cyclase (GGDEF) domain
VVYTHLFYVAIIMVGLWFKRYVIQLAMFLGGFHIVVDYLSTGNLLMAPILRGGIFLFVAVVMFLLITRLECTHENLDRIINSVGDGIIVVDLEKKVTMLNKVAENLTGWTISDARGKDFNEVFDLAHENPEYYVLNPVEEVLRTDHPYELTNHAVITSRNGARVFIEDSATPVKDNEGNTTGVVLIFRDVSERKAQKEKIEYLSYHDQLTGLYNRRYYEEARERFDDGSQFPLSIIMGDVNGLKMTNDAFGHLAGDALLITASKVLTHCCRSSDVVVRWGGDEFVILLPNADEEIVKKRMSQIIETVDSCKVDQGILSISFGWATKHSKAEPFTELFKNAESMMYKNKRIMKPEVRKKTINAIMGVLCQKSETEKIHAEQVCYYCQRIAAEMNMNEKELEELKWISQLHDIGKVTISKEILEKKGELAPEEWEIIKKHPETGYHIINTAPEMVGVATAILSHHERWDGKGYPKGLIGEEIPIFARIMAVGASYDTILSERAYKKAKTKSEALQELQNHAGTQFDPQIVSLFVNRVANSL